MFGKVFAGIVALVLIQIITSMFIDIVLDAVLLGLVYWFGRDKLNWSWDKAKARFKVP